MESSSRATAAGTDQGFSSSDEDAERGELELVEHDEELAHIPSADRVNTYFERLARESCTREIRGKKCLRGIWDAKRKVVVVTKLAGKQIFTTGHNRNGADLLLPEEALYLVEQQALTLYRPASDKAEAALDELCTASSSHVPQLLENLRADDAAYPIGSGAGSEAARLLYGAICNIDTFAVMRHLRFLGLVPRLRDPGEENMHVVAGVSGCLDVYAHARFKKRSPPPADFRVLVLRNVREPALILSTAASDGIPLRLALLDGAGSVSFVSLSEFGAPPQPVVKRKWLEKATARAAQDERRALKRARRSTASAKHRKIAAEPESVPESGQDVPSVRDSSSE